MTDPVKEAVERLSRINAEPRDYAVTVHDAYAHEPIGQFWIDRDTLLASHSRLEAENARLVKLVEEAGEALEPFAEVCERFQLKASDSPHALYGLPADYWLRASLTHKAITGGGEKPEPTAKLHPDFRRGVCTQCGEPKTPYCRCDEDWFFDMDGKP